MSYDPYEDAFRRYQKQQQLDNRDAVNRHRFNDDYHSPSLFKERGIINSVSFAVGAILVWGFFLCWAFWGGIPLKTPSSKDFPIQFVFWSRWFFIYLSMGVLAVFFYRYRRKGSIKGFWRTLLYLCGAAILSGVGGAAVSLFVRFML